MSETVSIIMADSVFTAQQLRVSCTSLFMDPDGIQLNSYCLKLCLSFIYQTRA